MSKIIVVILFSFIVICIGLEQEQKSDSETELNDKSEESDEDKYELESRQDFDKTSEKEKELKTLRKAKRLKETNYRRALESILPAKDSDGYRRFFEDLINDSDEKSRKDEPEKKVDEVVVTDTFADGEPTDDNNDDDPQVEEIEVVIEHFSDADNETTTTEGPDHNAAVTAPPKVEPPKKEKPKPVQAPPTNNQPKPKSTTTRPKPVDMKSRTGFENSRSAENMEPLQMARLEERRLLEPYPMSRFSEMVIPHYRTTLTRNGVMVSPAVYTVQTSSPIIDHVTNRNWIGMERGPSRGIGPDFGISYGRSASNKITRIDSDARLIDDYSDYGSNAYSYSPSKQLSNSRQGESKLDILSKIAEASLQPTMGNMKPFRESLYPGYYPQPQRYFPESYRPMFRIRR